MAALCLKLINVRISCISLSFMNVNLELLCFGLLDQRRHLKTSLWTVWTSVLHFCFVPHPIQSSSSEDFFSVILYYLFQNFVHRYFNSIDPK